jgi:hypothetical protein
MFEQVIDVVSAATGATAKTNSDAHCLGRQMTIGHSHPHTTLTTCSRTLLKATSWEYDHDLLILSTSSGLLSRFFGSLCVVRDGDVAATQNCNQGYTRLKVVIHTTTRSGAAGAGAEGADANGLLLANLPKTRHPVEHGDWTCARTGLLFPRNLDDRLPAWPAAPAASHGGGGGGGGDGHRDDRQIFMGGDIFTKTVFGMDFKVYTVGLYVELHAAMKDPSLRAFEGLAEGELANSPAFYAAVAANGAGYDRTLFIKLAMTIKSELMIAGLVEELGVSRESALLLKEASKAYTDPEMRRGLEILFTWRHARPATGGHEYFEVRMDGMLLLSVPNAALAHDFFTQFVHPVEPVSPRAKNSLHCRFPGAVECTDGQRGEESCGGQQLAVVARGGEAAGAARAPEHPAAPPSPVVGRRGRGGLSGAGAARAGVGVAACVARPARDAALVRVRRGGGQLAGGAGGR